ncbi:hypothetical protein [Halovivax sp.]|uniref:hypothetical protein n=1 Tax=Halovivax sp. TaxID=1935978 RepID=UPI0025B90367|nr:hypothetical protein [Halovivax sp.]
MSSIELATAAGMTVGGIDLIYAVTAAATAFLVLITVIFVALSLQPHLTGSAMTERKRSALVGLGAAAIGALWMVSVLLMAGTFSF